MKTTKKFAMGSAARGKKIAPEPVMSPTFAGRLPRITKLIALAIKFDEMLRDGVVQNQAELARVGFITRARITQIMNLLNLAPEIQEDLVRLGFVHSGKDEITERQLRYMSGQADWQKQLESWGQFLTLSATAPTDEVGPVRLRAVPRAST